MTTQRNAGGTVFVSHPFSSDPDKCRKLVLAIARRLTLQGNFPIAPQIYLPQFLDEREERDLALNFCLKLVAIADEVHVFGQPSVGMEMEIAEAKRLGVPVVKGKLS